MTSPFAPTALDGQWIEVVDRVATRALGSDDRAGQALGAEVRALSDVYTGRDGDLGDATAYRAARLRFFLPRDLPKIEGPLAELGRRGQLPEGPRWRVLDVGAGYGTTTLGLARLAQRAGVEGLEVTAVERDPSAIDALRALVREAQADGLVPPIDLDVHRADATSLEPARLGRFDLVVLGLSLGELFGPDEEALAESFLRGLAERLEDGGALIVLEPALRSSARRLQRLRDRLAEDPGGLSIAAPCFFAGPCPMLRRERDWCHAQLPLPLPERLGPIAKGAGLRWTRLTYAYLTLRRGEAPRDGWRIVGGPIRTKGKVEWDACGPDGLVRLRRLKRDAKQAASPLDDAERGDVIELRAEVEDGGSLRVRGEVDCRR